jgi:predicted  nucleic acid-binding Zn-ribbon protein
MGDNNSTKNWIYISLIAILGALAIYLFVSKNKAEDKSIAIGEALSTTEDARNAVQADYNAALSRMDAIKTENETLSNSITSKDAELNSLKEKISSILSNKNLTDTELETAKTLINTLNNKIGKYESQIATLKQANEKLATEKEGLSNDKENLSEEKAKLEEEKETLVNAKKDLQTKKEVLEQKVTAAKILRASNISITPIKTRWLTGKSATTTKAKRAELIKIKFDIDDNRVSETGEKQLYIVIYDTEGNAIENGKFALNDGTQKAYTTTTTVPYVQGQSSKNINFDWKPIGNNFDKGVYSVAIYHMGYLIGNQEITLK